MKITDISGTRAPNLSICCLHRYVTRPLSYPVQTLRGPFTRLLPISARHQARLRPLPLYWLGFAPQQGQTLSPIAQRGGWLSVDDLPSFVFCDISLDRIVSVSYTAWLLRCRPHSLVDTCLQTQHLCPVYVRFISFIARTRNSHKTKSLPMAALQ